MAKGKECVYLINRLIGEPAAYVGSTINVDKRFNVYKNKRSDTYIERAITKYGWESYQKIIIEVNAKNEKELRAWEDFYIGLFGTHKEDSPDFGMNVVRHPTLAISKQPEIARKISESRKGFIMSEEHKKKISESTKGVVNVGIKRPYLSERNRVVKPALGRTGAKHPMSKKLLYIPENKLFNSIKDAADYLGISRQGLRYRIKIDSNTYKLVENG